MGGMIVGSVLREWDRISLTLSLYSEPKQIGVKNDLETTSRWKVQWVRLWSTNGAVRQS